MFYFCGQTLGAVCAFPGQIKPVPTTEEIVPSLQHALHARAKAAKRPENSRAVSKEGDGVQNSV